MKNVLLCFLVLTVASAVAGAAQLVIAAMLVWAALFRPRTCLCYLAFFAAVWLISAYPLIMAVSAVAIMIANLACRDGEA